MTLTLFLFATVIKSRKVDTPVWKSSPFVLLHAADHNSSISSLKQAKTVAKRRQVQLQCTGENWHLQDVTGRHA